MLRRLSSGMTKDTRPLLLVTSVLKYTHSPDGGWVMMCKSTCTELKNKRNLSIGTRAPKLINYADIANTSQRAAVCDDESKFTFSPAKVTMSRGPYIKRPVTTCWLSSVNTASFTRWLAVTFCPWSGRKTHTAMQLFQFFFWPTSRCCVCLESILARTNVLLLYIRCLPWSSREFFCAATSLWVWRGWIQILLSHQAPGCWSFHASWPTGTFQWLVSSSASLMRTQAADYILTGHNKRAGVTIFTHLSQEKRHNISGLPVWCMKEVW